MLNEDCIYFEKGGEDTGLTHCKRIYSIDAGGRLCDFCQLWDSYIPKTSSPKAIEEAKSRHSMQDILLINKQIMRIISNKY